MRRHRRRGAPVRGRSGRQASAGLAAVVVACGLGWPVATVAGGSAPAAPRDAVVVMASDGTRLGAEWSPPQGPAPAVLLVHMLTRSHRDWADLARGLNAAGFGVLALDLRGHGSSGGSRSDLSAMAADVRAGLAWLRNHPDVLPGRLGIGGASLGSTLALLAASDDASVRSLALLSPAFDYRGVRAEAALRKFDQRGGAALLVAGAGDPYAARCARQAGKSPRGVRDVRIIEGEAAHGTLLLLARPDLLWQLVDWFRRTLL